MILETFLTVFGIVLAFLALAIPFVQVWTKDFHPDLTKYRKGGTDNDVRSLQDGLPK